MEGKTTTNPNQTKNKQKPKPIQNKQKPKLTKNKQKLTKETQHLPKSSVTRAPTACLNGGIQVQVRPGRLPPAPRPKKKKKETKKHKQKETKKGRKRNNNSKQHKPKTALAHGRYNFLLGVMGFGGITLSNVWRKISPGGIPNSSGSRPHSFRPLGEKGQVVPCSLRGAEAGIVPIVISRGWRDFQSVCDAHKQGTGFSDPCVS